MVEARTVLLLGVLGCVSILLAVGSGFAWYRADRARQDYLAKGTAARAFVDSLNVLRCVPVVDGASVRVYPPPRVR